MPRRKTQPSPEFIKDLVSRVQAGAPVELASESLGIHWEVCSAWLERGARAVKPSPCKTLSEEVRKARAFAKVALITDIRIVAKKDGKAALKMLESMMQEFERSETLVGNLRKMMENSQRLRGDHRGIPLDENDGDLEVPPLLKTVKVVRHQPDSREPASESGSHS